MGCTLDRELNIYETRQLDSYLTPEEIRLVKQSWQIVSEDLPGLGVLIFQRLFEKHKGITTLFGRLLATGSNGCFKADDGKLHNHAIIVMEGLGAAVESLEDSVYLTNVLITMGKKHATYKVHPDMVPYFWPAIRESLKETLEEEFTLDVERSWAHVFEYIANKFKQGVILGRQHQGK